MQNPQDPSPPLLSAAGLGLDFIHRVYRTSLVLVLLGALLLWEGAGVPAALGLLLGAGLSLGALAGVEWGVRRVIRPEARSAAPLVAMMLGKLVVIAVVLGLAYVGASRGWLSLPWMLAGFALPHAVLVLKLVGRQVRAMTAPPAGEDKRPPPGEPA